MQLSIRVRPISLIMMGHPSGVLAGSQAAKARLPVKITALIISIPPMCSAHSICLGLNCNSGVSAELPIEGIRSQAGAYPAFSKE